MLSRIVSWQLLVFPWWALLPRRHFHPPGFFIFLKVRYFARPRHKTPKPPYFRVNYVYGVWGFVWCIPVCYSARFLKLCGVCVLLRVFVFTLFSSRAGYFVFFPPAYPPVIPLLLCLKSLCILHSLFCECCLWSGYMLLVFIFCFTFPIMGRRGERWTEDKTRRGRELRRRGRELRRRGAGSWDGGEC